jgi:hypothetical protein
MVRVYWNNQMCCSQKNSLNQSLNYIEKNILLYLTNFLVEKSIKIIVL